MNATGFGKWRWLCCTQMGSWGQRRMETQRKHLKTYSTAEDYQRVQNLYRSDALPVTQPTVSSKQQWIYSYTSATSAANTTTSDFRSTSHFYEWHSGLVTSLCTPGLLKKNSIVRCSTVAQTTASNQITERKCVHTYMHFLFWKCHISLDRRLRIRILQVLKIREFLRILKLSILKLIKFELLYSSPPSFNKFFSQTQHLTFE